VEVLGRLYLRHQHSRTALARLRQQLNGISVVIPDKRGVPEPHWTRLNERYRPAVALARLIITTAGLEARAGGEDASAFLVDMNDVFERFIRAALGEALKLDHRALPAAARGWTVHLDTGHEVPLEPDLSWWADERCVFVGDCKYKKTSGSIPNADVYQMLAYLTALRLPDGLLVYAAGEDRPHAITIPFADKRILIRTVDVSQPPADVLAQVAQVASLIRSIAANQMSRRRSRRSSACSSHRR
jgi:5-methylcytosine-specific restriction enzyme subunit McrC